MLNFSWSKIFSDEELYNMRVNSVTQFLKCRSSQAVETSMELARVLNREGLDSQNYPLVLEFLREENFNVIETLLEKEDPYSYFEKVQIGPFVIDFALQMLDKYPPGRMYEKTLLTVLGIFARTYHDAKQGYKLYQLRPENLNAIGKNLDREKGQQDPVNRLILDVLADIGEYRSINEEDPVLDKLSAHAVEIRNAFFDRRLSMSVAIPAEMLVREDYRENTVMPRDVVPLND